MIEDKEIPQPPGKPPKLPKEVNDAFDAFFDLGSDATILERFDALLYSIMSFRMYLLERQRKTGKKKVDEEELFLFECNEQFKHIEKMLISAKRFGRLPVNVAPTQQYNSDILAKVVKMKGSMGDIVTNVPIKKGG